VSGDRIAHVRRLLEAARRVAARRDALVPAIVESTGLSPEGVALALDHHLEVDATDHEIAALVRAAGSAPRVAVVLSANVFVGALRAIALARAASDEVVVRPSRRDPAFARALVLEAGDPSIVLDEALDVARCEGGEIHVYGRDQTIDEVAARARPGVVVRGHGAGMGIAWISSRAELAAAAAGLASDVVVFDQRGCLSPRIALVEGDAPRALAFAHALHDELERRDVEIPRGQLPAGERGVAARYVATMTYAGTVLVGRDHAIGVACTVAPLVLPPPYRHVHVAPCGSRDAARAALEPLAASVTTVGSDDLDGARALAPSRARAARLGAMQRPPLDGPVDLRTR
jgi:hypothetical protein